MTQDEPTTFPGRCSILVMGMATTMDMMEIKQQVNSLIQEQTPQQETLVHVISI